MQPILEKKCADCGCLLGAVYGQVKGKPYCLKHWRERGGIDRLDAIPMGADVYILPAEKLKQVAIPKQEPKVKVRVIKRKRRRNGKV